MSARSQQGTPQDWSVARLAPRLGVTDTSKGSDVDHVLATEFRRKFSVVCCQEQVPGV
jgi:hypothetical protein